MASGEDVLAVAFLGEGAPTVVDIGNGDDFDTW